MGEYADEAVDRGIARRPSRGGDEVSGGNCMHCRAMIEWRRDKNGKWRAFDYNSPSWHHCKNAEAARRRAIWNEFKVLP